MKNSQRSILSGSSSNNEDEQNKKKKNSERSSLSSSSQNYDGILSRARDIISSSYGGWQSPETMSSNKSTLQSISSALSQDKRYASYLSDVNNALNNWDDITSYYGQYKNKDAFDTAQKKSKLADQYKGLSFDQVKKELTKYQEGTTEHDFFKNYTDYASQEDFDKALSEYDGVKDNGYARRNLQGMASSLVNNSGIIKGAGKLAELLPETSDEYTQKKRLEMASNKYKMEHTFDKYASANDGYLRASVNQDHYDDDLYRMINNGLEASNQNMYSPYNMSSKYSQYDLDQMTFEEKQMYNHLYERSPEEANQYLDEMKMTWNKRRYDTNRGILSDIMGDTSGAVAMNALRPLANQFGTLTGIASDVDELLNRGDYNPYTRLKSPLNFAQDVQEISSEQIAEKVPDFAIGGTNVGSFLYGTLNSAIDSALGATMYGSSYSALMGSSAFQNQYKDMMEAGLSNRDALLSALASGAAEAIFEKYSLDNLLSAKGIDAKRMILIDALKQGGVEASEEAFTELANIMSDNLIRGDLSDFAQYGKELEERGFSEDEIKNELTKRMVSQVSEAAIGGALSGAGMGVAYGGGQYYHNTKTGKTINELGNGSSLKEFASLSDKESDLYKTYSKYADKESLSNAEAGVLYRYAVADTEEKIGKAKTYDELSKSLVSAQKLKDMYKQNVVEDAKKMTDSKKTGHEVTEIKEENGKKVLVTEDGTVPIEEAKLSKGDATMVALLKNEDVSVANEILSIYDGTQNPDALVTSYQKAYQGGLLNVGEDTAFKGLVDLTEAEAHSAYLKGLQERKAMRKTEQDALARRYSNQFRVGKVDTTALKGMNLTERQNAMVTLAERLCQVTGMNIRFIVNTANENGIIEGKNGSFTRRNNQIEIDINAGINYIRGAAKEGIAYTLAHEVTHWMEEKAIDEYNDLRSAVLNVLAKSKDLSLEERIVKEIQRNRDVHKDLKFASEAEERDYAINELVARACEDMMLSEAKMTSFLEQMNEKNARSFVGRFTKALGDIVSWINEQLGFYEGSTSAEATFLREFKDDLEEVQKLWYKALEKAIEKNQQIEFDSLQERGQINDAQYSLIRNKDIADYQIQFLSDNGSVLSESELTKSQKVVADMVKDMIKHKDILPEDKIGKVLTKNGSYDISVENTTICVRTLAYNEFVDIVQEKIGRPMTQMESFLVSQKLYDIATDPQCLYCYVSLDRKSYNDMLLRYMTERDTAIDKYANRKDDSKATLDALYSDFLGKRKATDNMRNRYNKWIADYNAGVQMLSLADIATEENMTDILNGKDENLKSQLKEARKYAQSASWSKIQKAYVAYQNEILKLSPTVIRNLNKHYGLRWYSFSDYSAAFIVENMQQITDAAIRGLKGLAYTKDTDFVKIFAKTGMNINISVFVKRDADGNYYIDERQSANFEEAVALRNKYKNVGIVATVTDDDALRWAASQEWSDIIIPFHTVRTGADVANFYGWSDYTSVSGDKVKDDSAWDRYLDSLGKKGNARKKVSKNIYPSEHHNDKETYLKLCDERGLTPRFDKYKGEDWYMKLVNETRRSADESEVLKPEFDLEEAKKSFAKFVEKGGYEGGWYKEGIDKDAEAEEVASDIRAGKTADQVKYGNQLVDAREMMASRKNNRKHQQNSDRFEQFPTLKTLNGSKIQRSKFGVGKQMGSQVYIHKDYADEIVPEDVLEKAKSLLPKDFSYNCVMYDIKKPNEVRFDEAPDFDYAREPKPGKMLKVNTETGSVDAAKGNGNMIWHHKWQWVRNDYNGFDVEESYNWSKQWLEKISNPSGSLKVWNETLRANGLPVDSEDNTQYSLREVDAVEPTSSKWMRGHTEKWFMENGFPLYQDTLTEEEKAELAKGTKGHGTQIAGTVKTYAQLFDKLKNENPDNWQGMRVLDASSGLGLGTVEGRKAGFDVTDIEPFPGKGYSPDYTDYSELQDLVESGKVKPYDFIISNAVLNVIPQDTRDNLVSAMASLLNDGGQMFINVINKTYDGAVKSALETQYKNGKPTGSVRTQEGDYTEKGNNTGRGHETFVYGSNSVQKVFSYDELVAYLQDALGDGYKVVPYKKLGMTAAWVTKNGTAQYADRDYAPTFYSQMGKVVDGIKSDKIGASSVVNYLKGKGIKDEEIKWSGIETFLDGKKSITKKDLQEFVAGSMLKIEEEILGNDGDLRLYNFDTDERMTYEELVKKSEKYAEENGYTYKIEDYGDEYYVDFKDESGHRVESFSLEVEEGGDTNWKEYTVEGGQNYRELLFRLPGSKYSNKAMQAHWGIGTPGVLAHARIQDMETSEGKMLFVEEIQSDWHNAGNKNGYYNKGTVKKRYEIRKMPEGSYMPYGLYDTKEGKVIRWSREDYELSPYANMYNEKEQPKGAPDAPFKTTYTDYVMKRLLRMAAEGGYDSIGWTTAKMQEERWSDEFAEGYRIEYDQDIPKFMKKYGKQWGATVSKTQLESGDEVWSVKLTSEMKESVLYEGQAQFSDRDSDGNTLTKAQQEYFKDSKVRDKNGNLKVVYHGTKDSFTVFDPVKFGGKNGIQEGYGIYLSDSEEVFEIYGKENGIKGYANITRPAAYNKKTITARELAKLIRVTVENEAKTLVEDGYSSIKDAMRDTWISNYVYTYDTTIDKAIMDTAKSIISANTSDMDIVQEMISGQGIRGYKGVYVFYEILTDTLGIDGFIARWEANKYHDTPVDVYVAFNSNQVKSITNANPTSDPDIRYSDRDDNIDDILGMNESLARENQTLAEEVRRLNQYIKSIEGRKLDESQIEAAARYIKEFANSGINSKLLAKELGSIYRYIFNSKQIDGVEMFAKFNELAQKVADQYKAEKITDTYFDEISKMIKAKKIRLTEKQIEEVKSMYGENYKSQLRSLMLFSDEGTNLDTMWQEWAEKYPDQFDPEVSGGDQISKLIEIAQNAKEAKETVVAFDKEELVNSIAQEMYHKYWTIDSVRNVADASKEDARMLKREHDAAIAELKSDYEARIKQLERQLKFGDKVIENIRASKKKTVQNIKDREERQKLIDSITKDVKALAEMFNKNSKDKRVPDTLKPVVARLVNAIDFSSKKKLRTGEDTKRDVKLRDALDGLYSYYIDMNASDNEAEKIPDDLVDAIKELKEKIHMDDIERMLNLTVDQNIYILNNMAKGDLEILRNIVRAIKSTVANANKLIDNRMAEELEPVAQASMEYFDDIKRSDTRNDALDKAINFVGWKNATPQVVFNRLGKGANVVWSGIVDGWGKFAFHIAEIKDYAEKSYQEKESKEWESTTHDFQVLKDKRPEASPMYETITMTDAQIMSLYCLAKRENAKKHLFGGGIMVTPIKMGRKTKTMHSTVQLTESELNTIIGTLSDRQKEVADALQKFMNTTCSDWGNYVSKKRFDVEFFGEENYFPMNVYDATRGGDPTDNEASLFRLLNMSFTKKLVEKADQALTIDSVFNVFAQHSSEMAKYNALALPVLNVYKWLNYQKKKNTGEGTSSRDSSVKVKMRNAFGKEAEMYLTTLMKDLNGVKSGTDRVDGGMLGKIMSNAKIASVGANLRVAFLQPTAYPRASAVIHQKYLLKALLTTKSNYKEAIENSGMARWKSLGFFDINVARGVEEQIKHTETWKTKAVEMAMTPAEKGDSITWGYLWNACKLEAEAKGYKGEELKKKAAERLDEIIMKTQVVDSTITRSEIMRSKSGLDKQFTAFMSEPILSLNMLSDVAWDMALDKRRYGSVSSQTKHKAYKTISAYCMTASAAAIIEAFFDLWRKKDDDKFEDGTTFLKAFLENFADDLSIVQKIPIVKDIISYMKGYKSDSMYTSSITGAIDFAQYVGKSISEREVDNPAKMAKLFLKNFSNLTGLPIFNALRDAIALTYDVRLLTGDDIEKQFKDLW